MIKEEGILPKAFTDKDFDLLFSPKIQQLSHRHWTPLAIIKQTVGFLCQGRHTKVLDIGAGSGKFCLIGAMYANARFFGVENRAFLVKASRKIAKELGMEQQVTFIHSSVQDLDLSQFDAFYFFNSFHENLDTTDAIEKESMVDEQAYQAYTQNLKEQLAKLPKGTRIAIYCTDADIIQDNYLRVAVLSKGKLQFWERK
ncbi:class I SAM-dependent methyltransferase [Echinicola marina]|uniref:class I SAM-dependent methyltransferase n=1 Tax=Echinicola marina TaxID=2859768 RepID=UPI001CF6514F|nr:class I SAM-dependent methyltransferase [Echinicola marina]UCS92740.1 class I SAM-dependent methyltransferase [Echinicola marina]